METLDIVTDSVEAFKSHTAVVEIIALVLRDRRFRVHTGEDCSSWRRQSNGLPKGSVLSPSLFNVYINNLPVTQSRKFIHADDICVGLHKKSFTEIEEGLKTVT